MTEYDAIIIGAGISGISAAYHFQTRFPDKRYRIIEQRSQLGGTWDLFNYPGVRSDSDMHTFGFSFRPWTDQATIAEKDKILDYLHKTTSEFDIKQHIQYDTRITQLEWDSKTARWAVSTIEARATSRQYYCKHIFMCTGYYNYEQAHAPDFSGIEEFTGEVLHPQFWSQEVDYHDKNVVIIGSGATAITMVPVISEQAKHVTMLQRSPTYIASQPVRNSAAICLSNWFGNWAARWWFILSQMFSFIFCRLFPEFAKKIISRDIQKLLEDKFDAKHFSPNYQPWDQRVCLCPDGDFFEAIKSEKASIVTDDIERITSDGIQLSSGSHLTADIIVTATGLKIQLFGGIDIFIDGQPFEATSSYLYKGLMLSDLPNVFISVGYTNASWTLKVDLTNRYACRLIEHMEENDFDYCSPQVSANIQDRPLLDLSSGYVQRSADKLPKQGNRTPWKLYQNVIADNISLRLLPLKDDSLRFGKAD